MLVLSRKGNERICIGNNIELTVLSISGSQVRLGISAPRHVNIRRAELLTRKRSAPAISLEEDLDSPCLSIGDAALASCT